MRFTGQNEMVNCHFHTPCSVGLSGSQTNLILAYANRSDREVGRLSLAVRQLASVYLGGPQFSTELNRAISLWRALLRQCPNSFPVDLVPFFPSGTKQHKAAHPRMVGSSRCDDRFSTFRDRRKKFIRSQAVPGGPRRSERQRRTGILACLPRPTTSRAT